MDKYCNYCKAQPCKCYDMWSTTTSSESEAVLTPDILKEAYERMSSSSPDRIFLFLPRWFIIEQFGKDYDEDDLRDRGIIVVM